MPLHVIDHPLIRHKLSILRENDTPCSTFRTISNEIGALLVYEACRDLPTEKYEAQGWAGPVTLERVAGKMLTIVPILRAGLGLMDGVVSMIPGAKVSVVGLFRDEKTLKPVEYYVKLAKDIATAGPSSSTLCWPRADRSAPASNCSKGAAARLSAASTSSAPPSA